jgi:hypothetical protein
MATGLRCIPDDFRYKPALELFRMGFDTADIASFKRVHEATVVGWLHDARMSERRQRAFAVK